MNALGVPVRSTSMNIRQHVRFVIAGYLAAVAPLGFAQQPAQSPGAIEEIFVTGSYLGRESQFDSPSPLTTIGFEQIQDLGVNEISDIVERMTINTGSQNNPDAFTQNASTGTTNINLRGLPGRQFDPRHAQLPAPGAQRRGHQPRQQLCRHLRVAAHDRL